MANLVWWRKQRRRTYCGVDSANLQPTLYNAGICQRDKRHKLGVLPFGDRTAYYKNHEITIQRTYKYSSFTLIAYHTKH